MRSVRVAGSALLGALGVLCFLVGIVSSVLGVALTDSRGFQTAFAPVIRDEAVQQIITDALGDAVADQLHAQDPTPALQEYLAASGAPTQLSIGVDRLSSFAMAGIETAARDQIGRVIASDSFASVWDTTLHAVHSAIMTPLEQDSPTAVLRLEADGSLWLRTANMADAVRAEIESRSRVVAALLPTTGVADVKLVQHPALAQARDAARNVPILLALPWVAGFAFSFACIWLARDRRAAVVRWCLAAGATLLVAAAVSAWLPIGLSGTAGSMADAIASGIRAQLVTATLIGGVAVLLIAGLVWWRRPRP